MPTPVHATSASLDFVGAVTRDSAGNLYFVSGSAIYKVDPSGMLARVAGNGRPGSSGDGGQAVLAQLASPSGIVVDAAGNLYVAEYARIRKVTPTGIITTFAGTGVYGFSGDGGPAIAAQVSPFALALDQSGNLFVDELVNHRVRKIGLNGMIATVAGNGTTGYSGDGGPAVNAELNLPEGIATDTTGNLYISDYIAGVVRKVTPAGTITTIASGLETPYEIATDPSNNVYVLDNNFGTVTKITPGGGTQSLSTNLGGGLAVDAAGNLYGTIGLGQVVVAAPSGGQNVIAGNGAGSFSGDGGPAAQAQFQVPLWNRVASTESVGDLFVADGWNNRVRKISPAGVITTVAGNGTAGLSGDGGFATSAEPEHSKPASRWTVLEIFISLTI